MGAGVEEEEPVAVVEDPASLSIASTSLSVRSSAIITFLEIIILACINYSHVCPSWLAIPEILQELSLLQSYSSLTKNLIGQQVDLNNLSSPQF